MRFVKYPSIGKFQRVIKDIQHLGSYQGCDENGEAIYDKAYLPPVITVSGLEKIHGTNAAVCYCDGKLWVQSRSKIITPGKDTDNYGCASFVDGSLKSWEELIADLILKHNIDASKNIVAIFFEFCGGNIQDNSAVSGLSKRAIIFEEFAVIPKEPVMINPEQPQEDTDTWRWLNTLGYSDEEANIFNSVSFGAHVLSIDFKNPEVAHNEMIKTMETIEENSPVGKQLGVDGNIGEGLVYTAYYKGKRLQWKVKGDKHSKSPVKVAVPADLEKLAVVDKCVENITHNWRFEQALQEVFGEGYKDTIEMKSIGKYLKWVSDDTLKEELDIIESYGLTPSDVMKKVQYVAKAYFIAVLDK